MSQGLGVCCGSAFPRRQPNDGPKARDHAVHVGELDGSPRFWFRPDLSLALESLWDETRGCSAWGEHSRPRTLTLCALGNHRHLLPRSGSGQAYFQNRPDSKTAIVGSPAQPSSAGGISKTGVSGLQPAVTRTQPMQSGIQGQSPLGS